MRAIPRMLDGRIRAVGASFRLPHWVKHKVKCQQVRKVRIVIEEWVWKMPKMNDDKRDSRGGQLLVVCE